MKGFQPFLTVSAANNIPPSPELMRRKAYPCSDRQPDREKTSIPTWVLEVLISLSLLSDHHPRRQFFKEKDNNRT